MRSRKSSSMCAMCSSGSCAIVMPCTGVSTTISCAPTVFMRSNMPSARRSTPPSTGQRGAIMEYPGHPRAGGVAVLADGMGGHLFVSGAKGAGPAFIVNIRHHRTLACNHPAPSKGVQTQFSHVRSLSIEIGCSARWRTRRATGDSVGCNSRTFHSSLDWPRRHAG